MCREQSGSIGDTPLTKTIGHEEPALKGHSRSFPLQTNGNRVRDSRGDPFTGEGAGIGDAAFVIERWSAK